MLPKSTRRNLSSNPYLWRVVLSFVLIESLARATAAADVALDIRRDREVVVLNTVLPDTVFVALIDTLLKEWCHVALLRRVALIILTDSLSLFGFVHTCLAPVPKVSTTANGLFPSCTRDREGVAVDKRHITVCCSGAWEITFELSIASLGVGLGAYEHGTAGSIVAGHTDLAARGAECAGLRTPDAGIGVVPVRVVRCKADAFRLRGSINLFKVCRVHSWVDRGRPIVRASEIAFVILADSGQGLTKYSRTASCCQEEQTGLRIEFHIEGKVRGQVSRCGYIRNGC